MSRDVYPLKILTHLVVCGGIFTYSFETFGSRIYSHVKYILCSVTESAESSSTMSWTTRSQAERFVSHRSVSDTMFSLKFKIDWIFMVNKSYWLRNVIETTYSIVWLRNVIDTTEFDSALSLTHGVWLPDVNNTAELDSAVSLTPGV